MSTSKIYQNIFKGVLVKPLPQTFRDNAPFYVNVLRVRSLVVSDLRSETKGSLFQSGH